MPVILPMHRDRWTSPSRAAGLSEKPIKSFRGKHHLLVSLDVKFARYRCLHTTLQLLSLVFLAAAFLLLARHGLHRTSADSPIKTEQHRLLLATHNRLAWYYPYQDVMQVLHEGQGVHYGMFPGEPLPGHPHTVWNIIRPHNWRPATETEHLLLLDADTGSELQRMQVPSHFSHDAIRVGDRVYVCSTGSGSILELAYPDMTLLRSMPLFTTKDHPNTLAAAGTDSNHLWVLLHNLGDSDLVKVYIGPGHEPHEVSRIMSVGIKAHGLVSWGKDMLMLDSNNGALVSIDVSSGDVYDLYMVPEEGKFLKGLAVLDDIAYFGITTWTERSLRDSPDDDGELAAFDLISNRLLWRRTVNTAGLLNVIGAPHIAIDSTYAASYTGISTAELMRGKPVETGPSGTLILPDSPSLVRQAVEVLTAAGHPPRPVNPADYWSSGWPRLDPGPKLTDTPEEAGLQLPLFQANITALKSKLLSLPDAVWTKEHQALHNAVMAGRNQNMDRFKPGVEGIVLLFSDNECKQVYRFPYYETFKQELEPLLLEILGPTDIHNIVRLQLARMAPGTSDIKTHQDMGGYAMRGHRIHVPIITHPLVSFDSCPDGDATAAAALQGLAASAATGFKARKLSAASSLDLLGTGLQQDTWQLTGHQVESSSRAGMTLGPEVQAEVQQVPADAAPTSLRAEPTAGPTTGPGTRLTQPLHHWRRRLQQGEAGVYAYGQDTPIPQELPPGDNTELIYSAEVTSNTLHLVQHGASHPRQPQQGLQHGQEMQAQHPAALHGEQQHQRLQQQHRMALLRQQHARPCTKLFTPEGLVFELNNRVPHKVHSPAASGTTRVHLVIDVFETPRLQTPLPAGTECEYGAMPVNGLRHLQDLLSGPPGSHDVGTVEDEIRALVASPGMSCVGPDGRRVHPLRKAGLSAAEQAEEEQREEMVQQLLAQLQSVASEKHTAASEAVLNSMH